MKISFSMIRQFMDGNLDEQVLSSIIAGQLNTIRRRMIRQADRAAKREGKAQANAAAGLNGAQAVARRQWQIAAGQLSPIFPV